MGKIYIFKEIKLTSKNVLLDGFHLWNIFGRHTQGLYFREGLKEMGACCDPFTGEGY